MNPYERVENVTRRNTVPEMEELIGRKIPVLDDGWVYVVDYMGDEAAIVQAARVSYGKGTKKVSEDEGLLRYLMRHQHCYDAETEVLTSGGFVPWPFVDDQMKLGIWDDEKGTLCYEAPEYLTVDPYEGEMYRVDHGGVDLLVTPEHKMWVKVKNQWDGSKLLWDEGKLIPANELGDRSMVRYCKVAPDRLTDRFTGDGFPDHDDPRALLELVGFFIGDGGVGSRNTITFNIRKKRKRDFLRDVCSRLGWELREREDTASSVVASDVGLLFSELFYTHVDQDKELPLRLCKLREEDAQAVLSGLRASDGAEKRSTWSFSTAVRQVAENMQILALHAGESAHIYQPGESGACWRVMIHSRMREPIINQSRKNTSMVPYKGKVYCAKTRTGVLVVRRNGKIVLSGNTTPFEMCELKLHVRVPMDTWRQWIRHRTACLAGDTVLQFDLPSGGDKAKLYKLTIKEVFDRFQPTENTQRPDKQKNPYYKREQVQKMRLRCMNEDTWGVQHTRIVDVWEAGEKEVFLVSLENGSKVKMSEDHRVFTDEGWKRLKDICKIPATMKLRSPENKIGRIVCVGSGRNTGVPPVTPDDLLDGDEEWRPVVGWETYYEVSSLGRVRRVVGGRGSRSFGRCKKVTVSKGRAVVSLNRPGEQVTRLVSQLVLTAFGGERPEGMECCHNDGNALNNRAENLRWDTPQSNADDRVRDGATTGLAAQPVEIVSIQRIGKEMTYDIEVEGPWHNFSANGMIVHNSVNEYSTRYSEAIDSSQGTKPTEWRSQAKSNRQGSSGLVEEFPDDFVFPPYLHESFHKETPGEYLTMREEANNSHARTIYEERLRFGVAREQARKDLPLSTYTEAYWKIDLKNLLGFLGLRMDSHAQKEIRDYADVIGEEILARWLPTVWQAFNAYHTLRGAIKLTILDIQAITAYTKRRMEPDETAAIFADDLPEEWQQVSSKGKLKRNRERDEFEEKANRLGYVTYFKDEEGKPTRLSNVAHSITAERLIHEKKIG